ncbi:hypothetical protein GCM10027030_14350 [Luteococcus sediminum]
MNTSPRILAPAAGLAMAASLACSLPADAAVAKGAATGRTTAQLSVRTAPTTQAQQLGILHKDDKVTATCKVRGQRAAGNDIWYQMRDGEGVAFVAARYVKNVGALPHWCHGNTTTVLTARTRAAVKQAPLAKAPTVRTMAPRSHATAVCRVEVQQARGGTQGWYHLRDGRWVAVNSVLAKHATAACH